MMKENTLLNHICLIMKLEYVHFAGKNNDQIRNNKEFYQK